MSGGKRQTTVVSARELDTSAGDVDTHSWGSDRLAYTHGMGLIRFSGTGVGPDREPVLLDPGSGVRQPRIYFGNLIAPDASSSSGDATGVLASAAVQGLADSPWVLVDTRRPEVDVSPAHDASPAPYHYGGPAGIAMSTLGPPCCPGPGGGKQAGAPLRRRHRSVPDAAAPGRPRPAADVGALPRLGRTVVPADRRGPHRLRRRRLHHQQRLPLRPARGARRVDRQLRASLGARDGGRLHRRRAHVRHRPERPSDPQLVGELPHPLQAGRPDATGAAAAWALPERALRGAGDGVRAVPHR